MVKVALIFQIYLYVFIIVTPVKHTHTNCKTSMKHGHNQSHTHITSLTVRPASQSVTHTYYITLTVRPARTIVTITHTHILHHIDCKTRMKNGHNYLKFIPVIYKQLWNGLYITLCSSTLRKSP